MGNNRNRNNNSNNNNNNNHNHNRNNQNNQNNQNNNNNGNQGNRSPTVKLDVRGWQSSNAATNSDGGASALTNWLAKKAGRKIVKSYTQGDTLVIEVDQLVSDRFLHMNGWIFANAAVTIERSSNQNSQNNQNNNNNNNNNNQNNQQNNQQYNQNQNHQQNQQNGRKGESMQVENAHAAEVEAVERALVAVIQRCYNPGMKHLALDSLPKQAEFIATGLTTQPASKVFSAIFVCCETKVFETPLKRQQMVENLSLRDNGLTTIKDCIAAAGTFNTIKGLDLSLNQIKDVGELRYWRNRFPNLEHLLLEGNPVDGPETLKKMRQWYPKLNQYNGKPLEALIQAIPQPVQVPLAAMELLPNQDHPELLGQNDFGQPSPGKPGDQLMKEQMILRFSYETRLRLALSREALMGNNWDYNEAKKNLMALLAQGAIQNTEAFMWSTKTAN